MIDAVIIFHPCRRCSREDGIRGDDGLCIPCMADDGNPLAVELMAEQKALAEGNALGEAKYGAGTKWWCGASTAHPPKHCDRCGAASTWKAPVLYSFSGPRRYAGAFCPLCKLLMSGRPTFPPAPPAQTELNLEPDTPTSDASPD